jgi:murein DD-endopeptidase MepM/ murein hydrolase activator NlpD
MHIDIEIPRPGIALLLVAALSGWGIVWSQSPAGKTQPPLAAMAQSTDIHKGTQQVPLDSVATGAALQPANAPVSVPDAATAPGLTEAEMHAQQAREESLLLQSKEDILRSQLEVLSKQRQALGTTIDPALEEQFRQSTALFTALVLDQKKAEQFLLTSFNEMWEAEGRATALAPASDKPIHVALEWPVTPLQGISAYFLDKDYESLFKMKHYAIDIPTPQGTSVKAAAGGVIVDVVDHGLGFNYITIEHPGGYSTLYGHLSKLLVKKGDHVYAGDTLGLSGGLPGSPGAGFSTGPHLHFALHANGSAIDPLKYLSQDELQSGGK